MFFRADWFPLLAIFISLPLMAAEIQFPTEELASESVLPVFDQGVSVKNRNINLAKRFELGLNGGLSLLEPFYLPYNVGLTATYHFTDRHGLDFTGLYFMQGLSNNGSGLNPIPQTTTNMNLQYAPAPQYLILANYQYSAFYGKASLGKNFVMHLDLFAQAGGGGIAIGNSLNPVVDLGIGERLFFTPQFAMRLDYRFLAYQGPNVLSVALDKATAVRPAADFSSKLNYQSLLSLGAVYLF